MRGAAFVILGEMLLSVMGAIIKHLSPELPNALLVFCRNGLGLMILLPIVLTQAGGLRALKTPNLRFHLMRGLIGVSAMYCFFFSLGKLALTEAVLLKLTAPFFIPLVATFWLRERSSPVTWLAIAIGFCGVLVILDPGRSGFSDWLYVGAGLAGALLGGTAKVTIRRMGVNEPSARIVLYFGVIATLASAPAAAAQWQMPTAIQWGLLLALAACATIAQLCITTAYRIAPAGKVGQFTYSSVAFAAILGWWFWGETVTLNQAVGCALIVGAGLLNMRSR
ncbi:DMT family transporter [Marinobacteraceae bacterium S3BR75-40.1]